MSNEAGLQAQADAARAKLVADRDRLVAYLREAGGHVSAQRIAADLGMERCRPGYVVGRFPRYFGSWSEHKGKDRRVFIDLHPHLRLARTA